MAVFIEKQKLVGKGFNMIKERLFLLSFSLVLILMPLRIEFSNIFVIALACIWLWSGDYRKLTEVFKERKVYFLISFLVVFYVLTFLVYRDATSLKQLEKRTALVLFPLFIATSTFLTKKNIVLLIKIFGYVLSLICIYALAKISSVYIEYSHFPHFGEGPWVQNYVLMHRPYFGMYSVFAVISFIYLLEQNLEKRFIAITVVVLNVITIFFIIAKFAILFVSFFLFFKGAALAIKGSLKKGILLFLLVLTPLLVVYKYNKYFVERIESTIENHYRIKTWSCALETIGSEEFDLLIGSISAFEFQKSLDVCLEKKKFKIFNTHNQYLYYLGAYGVLGFSVFLIVLGRLFYFSFKIKDELLTLFLLLICAQCMTENILSRQWGIFFFSIFVSLLIRFSLEKHVFPND